MGIISNLENKNRRAFSGTRPIVIKAGYSGAQISRLSADMVTTPLSADTDLRWTLKTLRARCRDLAINNDYVRKFLWMVAANVVGPKGILLQSKIKDRQGQLDKESNKQIEQAFLLWGKKKNCTVTGMNSWPSFQRQAIQTVARDGEIFIRKLRGFPNEFGFALQALEADYVNEDYNDRSKNIRMGIEYDEWRRPIAYHFLESNVYDYQAKDYSRTYVRVPASEVLHLFIQERPEQGRGAPWTCTPMMRLQILGGYQEAELVASRGAAAKMGVIYSETGEEYVGDGEDSEGNQFTEVSPGMVETLPKGMKFESYDPQHPTNAYGAFVKDCLRGISSGLLVSYNSLANDLERVNYSSIRQGVIDERDIWRILQAWFIEHFCEEVFSDWKGMASLSAKLRASLALESNAIKWQPRGWAWVDPSKDVEASRMEIESGLNSRTKILGEIGEDLEDTLLELSQENKLIEQMGLSLSVASSQPKIAQPAEPVEPADLSDQFPILNRARRRRTNR